MVFPMNVKGFFFSPAILTIVLVNDIKENHKFTLQIKLMLLILVFIGILLSVILLFYNAGRSNSAIYLGAFFLLISLYAFLEYVTLYSKSVILVSIFYINIGFISYLTGPVIYWYVRSILTDNSRLRLNDLWHFIPMLLFFVTSLPYIFTPFEYKMEIAGEIVENSIILGRLHPIALYKIFPAKFIYLSRPVLMLGYTIWSFFLFIRFLKGEKGKLRSSQHRIIVQWLSGFFSVLFLSIICHLLLLLEVFKENDLDLLYSLGLLRVLSEIGFLCLLIMPFFFPAILYGFNPFSQPVISQNFVEKDETPPVIQTESRGSQFSKEYMDLVGEKIETYMTGNKPFLDYSFNLAKFSVLIQIPAYHLTYYFREVKKQSFTDYRNEWRVNYSKKLMREGKASEMTLEAIGVLSGFSSRNTFFTAFKKQENTSPGVYVARFSKQI